MPINRRTFLRRLLPVASTALLMPELAGCGSILHPERVGQPRQGPLDWKVVALDGLGLLLFFVPGVVAFAVDFYNGTIYLPNYALAPTIEGPTPAPPIEERRLPPPPGESARAAPTSAPAGFPPGTGPAAARTAAYPPHPRPQAPPGAWARADFEAIPVRREQLTREGIEQLVSQRLGRPVPLDREETRVIWLEDLAEFGNRTDELADDERLGLPPDHVFRRS